MHINEKSKTWMVSFEYLQCKNHNIFFVIVGQKVSGRKWWKEGYFIFKLPMSAGVITGTANQPKKSIPK